MKFYTDDELNKLNNPQPEISTTQMPTGNNSKPKEKLGKRIKNYFKNFFKTEGAKLKKMTFGEKVKYIWEYYKIHIIIVALIAFLVISIGQVVYRNIKYESVFHCAMVNSLLSIKEEEYIIDDFGKYIGIDKEHETLTFDSGYIFMWDNSSNSDTNLTSRMKVASSLAAQTLDIFLADETYIVSAAPEGQLYDLTEVLPENIFKQIEDRLFYTEGEDGTKRAYAIDLTGSHLTTDEVGEKILYQTPPYFAIVINTEHLDMSIQFLKYALELE